MTFNDKTNLIVAFKKKLGKKQPTLESINSFVEKLNLKRWYMEETETKEEITNFLINVFEDEIYGVKMINPNTYEIEYRRW